MMVKPWNNRSDIEAALFNPAFCGELILHAVRSYNKTTRRRNFPYALAYLILPFLLNAEVFKALPRSKRTNMITWLLANNHLSSIIANKAKEYRDYTNEALLLYLSQGMLQFDEFVALVVGTNTMVRKKNYHRAEVDIVIKRADFIGSWLSEAGDVVTIYSIIGVTI